MRLTAAIGVLPATPAGPERIITQQLAALRRADPALRISLRASTLRRKAEARAVMDRVAPWAGRSVGTVPPSVTDRLRFPPERLTERFDVYHQFHLDSDPVVSEHQLVVTVQDVVALEWPVEEGALSRRARRLVARANRVVVPSEHSRQAAIERLGAAADRTIVVPYGVDHDRFSPDAAVTRVPGLILFVGGDTPRKNLDRLLSALAELRAEPSTAHAHLILAGPVGRSEASLRARSPRTIPASAIQFAGHVSDAELVQLYRSADVVAATSLSEGFGLPVLEALACGSAVVTSSTTALPEAAGDAATLVDPTDTAAIAAGLHANLSEPAHVRAERSRHGIEHAARFTWDAAARRLLEVYRSIG